MSVDQPVAMAVGSMLVAAGAIEVASVSKFKAAWASRLTALGFFMLGARYIYLGVENDVVRLSWVGSAAIATIAAGRIVVCTYLVRRAAELARLAAEEQAGTNGAA